jgi:uncharacterized protein YdaL
MRAARTLSFLGMIVVALLVFLGTSAGAGAGGKDKKPPRPVNEAPSADALVGTEVESTRGDKVKRGGTGIPLGRPAPGAAGSTTLVLYDTTNTWGWAGELFAMAAGNLVSHFGAWKAEPVASYRAGQIAEYDATVYIGSTYDEPVPTAFLDDVYNTTRPVIWMYDNIWELTNRYAGKFQAKYGWTWSAYDFGAVSRVVYKGITLTRDAAHNRGGIMDYGAVDPAKATVLAWAQRDADGSRFPWAIRSGSLTYIGENPFTWMGTDTDRVIAFEDLLFDALQPDAPTRHRAMVRLEDIFPNYDTAQLKAVTDYLYSQGIPFGFGVSPVYADPLGAHNGGVPQTVRLSGKGNGVATMITYMQSRGGTSIMHGYTHQYSNVPNPFSGVTGDDAEFYRVTWNADHTGLNYEGALPEDSVAWAGARIDASFKEFKDARLKAPTIFEFPHYLASASGYQAVAQRFSTRWERALYYGGLVRGGDLDLSHVIGQSFPYVVRDVYGTVVLPENLGDYSPGPWGIFPAHTVDDILAAGKAELAVRDGVASFFYHPFMGVPALKRIVDGLRAQGWTFVSPDGVAGDGASDDEQAGDHR